MFWKLFACVCLLVTVAAGLLVLNRTGEGTVKPAPAASCPAGATPLDKMFGC